MKAPLIPSAEGSIFQDVLELLVARTGVKVAFEDLTGFTFDAREFALDLRFRQHDSAFCVAAKAGPSRACFTNKRICNRLVLNRESGFSGMCHLGLTEAVEPLTVQGKILGIFYFGTIVLQGTEAEGRERIEKHCRRHRMDAVAYLERYRAMPHLDEATWNEQRLLFLRTVGLLTRLVDQLAPPLQAYALHRTASQARTGRRYRALVRKAIAFIEQHFSGECTLNQAARALGCHPVHLSRTFKGDVGTNFAAFVHRVRIAHAKRLLHTRDMNVTRVAYEVGYADSSHFCRTFKQATGQTPAEYLQTRKDAV
ncbi:MAG TPA: helix-turn-helix domain-containing protein [Chthoniobacteraceae bacterium]|nr:helix-turn-helix domain-containing protein [Chthoniobacteraceae bacterium]